MPNGPMPTNGNSNPMNNPEFPNLGTKYEQRTAGPIRSSRSKKYENLEFPLCRDVVEHYDRIVKIGQGTFGEVFKGKQKGTKAYVALKKVIMDKEKEGFPITTLREIRILKRLKHENIVQLLEVCRTKANETNKYRSTFFLVFEFCDHDLSGLLSSDIRFTLGDIKRIMQQLLDGLFYIHYNKILHRDLKASNILVTKNGVLKLADFGLARTYNVDKQSRNRYTNKVVTLWYRPPELLLGMRDYGPAIDMWGVGCIMAELWTRNPILQGSTDLHQLRLISCLCGSITPEVWPGVENLESYNSVQNLERGQARKVKEKLEHLVFDRLAIDLIDKLLVLDPKKRIDSDMALNHDFFWKEPLPSDLSIISKLENSMYELNVRRKMAQQPGNQQQFVRHQVNGYTGQSFERVF